MGLRRSTTAEGLHTVVVRDHPRDLAGLLAQLRQGDAQQRRWAARDLAGHPEALPMLVQALVDEPDHSVRERLFSTLATLGGTRCAEHLLPLLHSEDAELRNGAIDVLADMPEAVEPHVARLLADADADARLLAVNLIGQLPHPRVREWLLKVLSNEPELNVVAAAIEALAEVGQAQDADALRAAGRRFAADPFIGFAVDLAVARLQPDADHGH